MSDPSLQTTHFHHLIDRMRNGDEAARDQLLDGICKRLETMARAMLAKFPPLKRWVDPEQVLNDALMRLLKALQTETPQSMREFYAFASVKMRQVLIDLYRHFYGPMGVGANHQSGFHARDAEQADMDPADTRAEPSELERWGRFHEAIAELPAKHREVVNLIFYHDWSQQQIATLFDVSERTIRLWWQEARVKLHELLGDGKDESAVG